LHFLHLSLFFCYNFLTCNCSFSCISYTCHHSFIVIGSKRRINILFFILLHCWCLPLFFCSYTLNPSLLLALLSLFYRTSIGMLQVLWEWKNNPNNANAIEGVVGNGDGGIKFESINELVWKRKLGEVL
jgi:hypothetical protein